MPRRRDNSSAGQNVVGPSLLLGTQLNQVGNFQAWCVSADIKVIVTSLNDS